MICDTETVSKKGLHESCDAFIVFFQVEFVL